MTEDQEGADNKLTTELKKKQQLFDRVFKEYLFPVSLADSSWIFHI